MRQSLPKKAKNLLNTKRIWIHAYNLKYLATNKTLFQ
jgi:hypothetical protein